MNESKFLVILIAIFIFLGCKEKKKSTNILPSGLNIYDLKKEIVYDKNLESYGVFLDLSANDSLNYEALSFSILLADDTNAKANMMVFIQMVEVFNKKKFSIKKFNDLPGANKNFAFFHLKKAAVLEYFPAQVYLEEIYRKGIGVDKNEMKADSILNILRRKEGFKEEHRLTLPGMRETE